jgi:SAM-dependent methyltransferase
MAAEKIHELTAPSPWVVRFAPLIAGGARVLDVACGTGRHARLFAGRGCLVEAVDRDAAALAGLADVPNVQTRVADLENAAWPYAAGEFDAVIVTNYLHRPKFAELIASLGGSGVLIYETFMDGNAQFGRPASPDFLLRPGELLQLVAGTLEVVAFEQGYSASPRPAMVQRLTAVKPGFQPPRAI